MTPRLLWASLAVAPLGFLSVGAVIEDVRDFTDSCMTWGVGGGGNASSPAGGPPECPRGRSSTNSTKYDELVRLFMVQGVTLVARGAGAWGILARQLSLTFVGALLILLETVPFGLGGLWFFPLLTSAALLLAYRLANPKRSGSPPVDS